MCLRLSANCRSSSFILSSLETLSWACFSLRISKSESPALRNAWLSTSLKSRTTSFSSVWFSRIFLTFLSRCFRIISSMIRSSGGFCGTGCFFISSKISVHDKTEVTGKNTCLSHLIVLGHLVLGLAMSELQRIHRFSRCDLPYRPHPKFFESMPRDCSHYQQICCHG